MTSLPIPLVVAFLLLVLAAANHQRLAITPTGRVFELVLYLFAASLVCIGLRWTFDLIVLLPAAAAFSVIGMALTYLAFRSLGRKGPVLSLARDAWHLLLYDGQHAERFVGVVVPRLGIGARSGWSDH